MFENWQFSESSTIALNAIRLQDKLIPLSESYGKFMQNYYNRKIILHNKYLNLLKLELFVLYDSCLYQILLLHLQKNELWYLM